MTTEVRTKGGAGGEDEPGEKAGGGGETRVEFVLNRWVGEATHLLLSLLSVFILAAAAVAAYDTAVTEVPKLFTAAEEHDALQKIIQNVLLVAIAAELGLLMLFHRTSTAVEFIIFVIVRARTRAECRRAGRPAHRELLLPAG